MFMRKNVIAGCVALIAVMLFAAAFVVIAADVPETITLQPSLWPEPTKGPVIFHHQKHSTDYKIACTECHHKYENGTNVWKEGDPVQKCEECHTDPTIKGKGFKVTPRDKSQFEQQYLVQAYHLNCLGCHRDYKKEHKDSKVPTTCTKCHEKN
jgi:hypothetical protein